MEKEANAGEVSEEDKKIDELEGMLKERVEELHAVESFQSCILSKKQETDDELEEIKGIMIEMEKEANAGEVSEENKRIDELEGMLKERAEELQAAESFQSCILNKKQETDDELEQIKGIMIEMEKEASAGEVSEEDNKIDELEGMRKERAEELQAVESFQSCILNKKQETDDELEEIKGIMIEMAKDANAGEVSEENKRIDELEGMLKERAEELQAAESFLSCILHKKQETDDELEEIKGIMIEGLIDVPRAESPIGVKTMGRLDEEVFLSACKLKGAKGDLELEAALLCSKWQNEISKPDWHPFRITIIDGEAKEDIVDDEKLIALKEEWGTEAYNAVVRALVEMNKYNPSARHPVSELWNFIEDREASVSEAIAYMMKDMKI